MVLGIETAPATEDQMGKKKTEETKVAETATVPVEGKPIKKAATARTPKAKKATPPKTPKAKKERPPKEDLVVFACRVAETERVAFHTATGPAGASRFARQLMVVFSNEDETGFRALLKEAQGLRK